jgi:hypothetical protein
VVNITADETLPNAHIEDMEPKAAVGDTHTGASAAALTAAAAAVATPHP